MFSLVLIAAAFLVSGVVAALVWIAVLSRRAKATGKESSLIGCLASVEKSLNPEGAVLVRGELWPARSLSGERIARGNANVRIISAGGHYLEVEPTVNISTSHQKLSALPDVDDLNL